jgi:uncharacterized SAM-binding protein YcdF (DUF218 family)
MSAALGFALSLGGFVTCSVAAILFVLAKPGSRIARRLIVLVIAAYTCMSIYGISHRFVAALSSSYKPFAAADGPQGKTAVVVLGSGGYTIRDWAGNELSTPDAYAGSRALETARVYRLVNPAYVIASGGKISPRQDSEATGEIVRQTLLRLGIPPDRLETQITSRNTHEEAEFDSALVRKLGAEHLVLVTSDFHMWRSVGAFRAAGFEVIPAISRDPLPARFRDEWIVPGERGLREASVFAHEVFGVLYYRLRGWYQSKQS